MGRCSVKKGLISILEKIETCHQNKEERYRRVTLSLGSRGRATPVRWIFFHQKMKRGSEVGIYLMWRAGDSKSEPEMFVSEEGKEKIGRFNPKKA